VPQPVSQVSPDDIAILVGLVGDNSTKELIALNEKVQQKTLARGDERRVVFPTITDRTKRTSVHQVSLPRDIWTRAWL
jgi:hypothetical protein